MSVSSITVKDASGVSREVNTITALGQTTKSASRSVVLASDHGNVPVELDAAQIVPISFARGYTDAFGRLRTGEPRLLLDLKRVGGVPDLLATNGVSGTGSAAYQANRSSTFLTVGSGAGSASVNAIDVQQQPVLTLGKTLAGARDTFSLQIYHMTNQNEDFFGSMSWREIF